MLITCKCLNVVINTEEAGLQNIDLSSLELSSVERNDRFFQEDIATVELVRISKEQSCLVQVRNVGNWIIHFCLNCLTNTHAINREKGAGFVLVNQNLLTNPAEIAALKSSDKYSPVFRIVINSPDSETSSLSQTAVKFSVSGLPNQVQAALAALQQQLGESVQQEAVRTEERVRQFSEQQYAALEEFRDRAHYDHRALVRLLCEEVRAASVTSPGDRSPSPELKPLLTRQPSRPATKPSSADSEGLFELEGMDDNPETLCHSDDESDTDDSGSHDEGIHIPRGRGPQAALARSLPVNVPAFLPPSRRLGDIREDRRPPQEPEDIAASIKALAKSVHGDSNVFGDLPRPRFSTQI